MGYEPGWGRRVRARELMFSHFASASMQVRTPANSLYRDALDCGRVERVLNSSLQSGDYSNAVIILVAT